MIRSRDQAKLLREYQGIDIGSDNEDVSSGPHVEVESAKKSKDEEEKPAIASEDQPAVELQLNETIKNVDEEKKVSQIARNVKDT